MVVGEWGEGGREWGEKLAEMKVYVWILLGNSLPPSEPQWPHV